MFKGRIAGCQGTMMEDTGHCGSYPCLVALTLLWCSMKSKSARKRTQMLIYVVQHLTTRTRVSAWPLSFRSQTLQPPPVLEGKIQSGKLSLLSVFTFSQFSSFAYGMYAEQSYSLVVLPSPVLGSKIRKLVVINAFVLCSDSCSPLCNRYNKVHFIFKQLIARARS